MLPRPERPARRDQPQLQQMALSLLNIFQSRTGCRLCSPSAVEDDGAGSQPQTGRFCVRMFP